jgi:hypothetical protein
VADRNSIPESGIKNVRTLYESGASEVKTSVVGISGADAEALQQTKEDNGTIEERGTGFAYWAEHLSQTPM